MVETLRFLTLRNFQISYYANQLREINMPPTEVFRYIYIVKLTAGIYMPRKSFPISDEELSLICSIILTDVPTSELDQFEISKAI